MKLDTNKESFVTVNPCRLCTPLGACLAFRGIQNCMPIIHGSQGCATYIRRFLISHFREPMDIASSSFSEDTAIFGGEKNLREAFDNVIRQYNPDVIGIATSCLTETIGDDVGKIIRTVQSKIPAKLVSVSTPSFKGSHCIGFHETVTALVKSACKEVSSDHGVFIAPPILSTVDIRYIKSLCKEFSTNPVLLPDYSETLDGGVWDTYTPIPEGGTPFESISAAASPESVFLELGSQRENSAGDYLSKTFTTKYVHLDTPIGIEATDRLISTLSDISGIAISPDIQKARGRCIDSYIDAHKYVSGVRTVVYGDEDMVPSLVAYCLEIGLEPVLCASEGKLRSELERRVEPGKLDGLAVCEDADFNTIEKLIVDLKPDLMIGTGKGNHISIKHEIPLVRAGFPVHDRFGANRLLHVGYDGALALLDTIVNTLLSGKQENIPDGYSYL
ncbi:MAG: nitrogenase [Fibrobacter sp.]|nr:nitrogenase [Fibrobacter sp.]